MKITVTGSIGNISRRLAEKLIVHGHQATIISHNHQRAKEIESMGAKAAIGSVDDLSFLEKSFEGADAVYTMVPPDFAAPDYGAFTSKVQENYVKAITHASVSHVVNLSSVGSALAGIKPLIGYQNLEDILNDVSG